MRADTHFPITTAVDGGDHAALLGHNPLHVYSEVSPIGFIGAYTQEGMEKIAILAP